jgi:hypothetical protein
VERDCLLQFSAVKKRRGKKIGLVGFEPTASASRTQRSTKLSHSPHFRTAHPPGNPPEAAQRPYFAHFADAGKAIRSRVEKSVKPEKDCAFM